MRSLRAVPQPEDGSGPEQSRAPVSAALPADLARLLPAAVYTARTGELGEWLYVSPQIEAIIGFTPEELLADPGLWARQLHPEDRDRVLALDEEAYDGALSHSYAEYRMVSKDGRVVWVLDDLTVLPDADDGSLQHGLLFDITARKRIELLLAEQVGLFGRIARGDELGTTLAALAASVQAVTGAGSVTVVVDPDGEAVRGGVDDRAAGDPRPAAGSTEHVPLLDAHGTPLGHLVLTGVPADPALRTGDGRLDLAWAVHLAVLAVGRSRQEEREARSFSLLEATLESTADGILVVDGSGGIAGHNQKFRQMWHLPDSLVAEGDDARLIEFVVGQLTDPQAFLAEVGRLYASPEESSFDVIEFLDGRVFQRYSQPQLLDGQSVGRVWSFRDVTDYRRLEVELRRQAQTDALTGLPNRHMFMERMAAVSDGAAHGTGLLLIDVDDFKTVNDGLGHLAGDAMLVALAERLVTCVRSDDLAARLGGDEFAVLLTSPTGAEDACRLGDRIITALAEPIDLDGRRLSIRASIGIALSAADCDAGDLVRNADLAMYTAKRDGGACHRVYAPSMHSEAIARLNLKADLGRAIEENALSVVYQPLVGLGTGRVQGFEALARWDHPQLGPISPVVFVPLAEETGLIDRLGAWVLTQACTELARWHALVGAEDAPGMSVNLSPQQLRNPALTADVEATLAATGVPAGALCLEVTESGLGRADLDVTGVLRELSALGVRLALDDFGTGHSSLARLETYPFDTVKIDRAFISRVVDDRSARAIVEAVLGLAEAFDLDVVAEGIETPEQLAALRATGCQQGQGFLFSRPVTAAVAHGLLGPSVVLGPDRPE